MAGKTEKGGKFRKVHCRTWNMARKLKIMENEKYTLQDVKYGWNNKKPRIAKTLLKDKRISGGITMPDLKLYYRAIVIKNCMVLVQRQTSRPMEQN